MEQMCCRTTFVTSETGVLDAAAISSLLPLLEDVGLSSTVVLKTEGGHPLDGCKTLRIKKWLPK